VAVGFLKPIFFASSSRSFFPSDIELDDAVLTDIGDPDVAVQIDIHLMRHDKSIFSQGTSNYAGLGVDD